MKTIKLETLNLLQKETHAERQIAIAGGVASTLEDKSENASII